MNGFTLKLIAMIIMVIDHIGVLLLPEYQIFRLIGRLSFPIFAYFVAEGIIHTSNIKEYIVRMFLFATITEPIYDLVIMNGLTYDKQNIMFTFLLVIIGICISRTQHIIIQIPILMLVGAFAEICHVSYGFYGVVLVGIYYFAHKYKYTKHCIAILFMVLCCTGIQRFAAISTILLMTYNETRGKDLKYLFYWFYPVHLLILFVLKVYLII